MTADQWFVLDRGKVSGPFSHDQLTAMRGQGILTSFTKISQDRASWESLDGHLNQLKAQAATPAPLRPPPLEGAAAVVGGNYAAATVAQRLMQIDENYLRPFPVVALILLHFLTTGLFSFFWITGMHGKLPRTKGNDPTAAKAIGLCLVPFFNLYWIFIVYPRLAVRVNALSGRYRLPAAIPTPLPYIMCLLLVIPATMATAGGIIYLLLLFSSTSKWEVVLLFFLLPNVLSAINLFLVIPIYSGLVQTSINRIALAQVGTLAHAASNPESSQYL